MTTVYLAIKNEQTINSERIPVVISMNSYCLNNLDALYNYL